MERSALWLILLIAGCTPPQPGSVDARPGRGHTAVASTGTLGRDGEGHAAVAYRRPQPLNCGTPDTFKICAVPLIPVVVVAETLPPLPVPMVDIIQLPVDLVQLPADEQ